LINIAICLLTLNSAASAGPLLDALAAQSLSGVYCLVIDSSSIDGTVEVFTAAGFHAHSISANAFNHGATRQLAIELLTEAEIIIFMTQDAILADPYALQHLLSAFDDPRVGAAYGRQLPANDATPIAAHARIFNYPSTSRVVSKKNISLLGVKAAFLSNSFAAYRREALQAVGGFPSDVILGEDTYVAAKMLQSGWKIAYCAEARVYHSHNYSMLQEFRRYFDTGVFHAQQRWFLDLLGRAEGEGKRFVLSELTYLSEISPRHIVPALLRTMVKLAGYRLGSLACHFPAGLNALLSMNRAYWRK
jgi:rhamnosyltransferase